jgi:hypothetical protein
VGSGWQTGRSIGGVNWVGPQVRSGWNCTGGGGDVGRLVSPLGKSDWWVDRSETG